MAMEISSVSIVLNSAFLGLSRRSSHLFRRQPVAVTASSITFLQTHHSVQKFPSKIQIFFGPSTWGISGRNLATHGRKGKSRKRYLRKFYLSKPAGNFSNRALASWRLFYQTE